LSDVADDAPLRLDVAAALAFPDGSMTAAGLRREAAKGHLALERIAGKYYTTLRDIKEMRELCRVPASEGGRHDRSASVRHASEQQMKAAQAAAFARVRELRKEICSTAKPSK
jgi:protein-disulfide isomerase-like protein with CxxC motif